MTNQKQAFVATYTPVGICYIYKVIEQHLGKNKLDSYDHLLPNKQMYHGNSYNSIKALAEKLEVFLDSKDELHKFDISVIHGHQSTKEEKAAFLKHFSTCNGEGTKFKITCAPSGVANAGIDCKEICFVSPLDLPPSIWDLAQEMGHAGRGSFATSDDYVYFLFFSLLDVMYLFKRMNNPSEQCI